MKKMNLLVLIILLFAMHILPEKGNAIPAFARRYKISCSTCHAPIPKLKPYGDEFAGNGFIMLEEEKARDYISAGDDMLWLNRTFPIGARFDAYAQYDQDNTVENDLQTPWGIKILSGGALYKNIGYYFYFYMSERGEVAGIEDAYIHFNNVKGSELDIMVGQFQTSDPLMKRELRLTFEDYMIYKSKIGLSNTNLAYDRGVMLVYGIPKTGTDLVGFVVNGNGKEEAGDDKKFDQDKFKNFGFRVNQGLGEFGSIGAYYYRGKERLLENEKGLLKQIEDNEVTFYGPDINLSAGNFEFTGQYLVRKDSKPNFMSEDKEAETTGIIAEAIFAPHGDRSKYYFAALYNRIESDLQYLKESKTTKQWISPDKFDYETATFSASYLAARNLRFIAEYTRDLIYDKNRFTFGFVSGF